jgi:hypothetical protein
LSPFKTEKPHKNLPKAEIKNGNKFRSKSKIAYITMQTLFMFISGCTQYGIVIEVIIIAMSGGRSRNQMGNQLAIAYKHVIKGR